MKPGLKHRLHWSVGFACLSLGVGVLGMNLQAYLPEGLRSGVVWFAWSLVPVGAVLLIYSVVPLMVRGSRDRLGEWLRARYRYEFVARPLAPAEVPDLLEFGTEHVREGVLPTAQQVRERLKVSPECVTCFYRKKRGRERLVGYYVLYPLRKRAHRLIREGGIRNGKYLLPEHLCRRRSGATALYIGALLGTDFGSQAFVSYQLRDEVKRLLRTSRSLRAIYAKPATLDGKRLLEKLPFGPVHESSEIWWAAADAELQRRIAR